MSIFKVWQAGKGKELIFAKCRSREEKERVIENNKKLRKERIYIDNDLI